MTVKELDALCRQLTNIAENLEDLICPEWSSALDITNELHRLQEAVDDHSLNQRWFSVHARADGTVMMVTTQKNPPGKSKHICFYYSDFMANCHAFYL
jgi:hypothetical protein